MSHVLEIPDVVYSALEKAAQAQGMSPADWIAAQLAKEKLPGPEKPLSQTLADRFAGRVGRIRSGGQGQLSQRCGENFAHYLETKKQAGHL